MNKTRKPVLDVLHGQVPNRLPIWLMRQAGRYLPEYRDLRAKSKNFLNMCLTPELATEITLQPIRRFGFDAAILFADILLVPMALGLNLEFKEGEGPVLETMVSRADFSKLSFDKERTAPVFETVRRVKADLPEETTLIGFCGSPWTVACYMLDGNSRDDFAIARQWAKERPDDLDELLSIVIAASEPYLAAQVEAGAEVLQLFDSWAGALSGKDFTRFVVKPTRELALRLKRKYPEIPLIGFPREAGVGYVEYAKESGVDAMSIDTLVDVAYAREALQPLLPLQGNLNPAVLVQGSEAMKEQALRIMNTLGPRHIFNLGHGVVPQTPTQHVADLVELIRGYEG